MKQTPHIELDNFWPYQVVVLADQISRYTLSVVRTKAGLNSSQWRVLAAVADKPGRTAAEVTSVTPMDKTIVSRAVASLIETGLIKKSPKTGDKRRHALTMTSQGLKIYTDIAVHLSESLMGSLSPEKLTTDFIAMIKDYSVKIDRLSAADH